MCTYKSNLNNNLHFSLVVGHRSASSGQLDLTTLPRITLLTHRMWINQKQLLCKSLKIMY